MLVERYGQLNKTYSDFELVELKNKYSWPNLSKLTGIPVSTLQGRIRRFINKDVIDFGN